MQHTPTRASCAQPGWRHALTALWLGAATALPAQPMPPPEPRPQPTAVPATPKPAPTAKPAQPAKAPKPSAINYPTLVALPGGSFLMGDAESAYADERPTRTVNIKAFAMGEAEVTVSQYLQCVSAKACSAPGSRQTRGDHPIAMVNWLQANQYASWFSRQAGLAAPHHYRLPTEAEWEYAARANSSTAWSHGDDEGALKQYAWYSANAGYITHAAKGLAPNAFKLYDMHGNVSEWVQDCKIYSYKGAPSDGSAVGSASDQNCSGVARGGSWRDGPKDLRSANRGSYHGARFQYYNVGFRLARTLFTP